MDSIPSTGTPNPLYDVQKQKKNMDWIPCLLTPSSVRTSEGGASRGIALNQVEFSRTGIVLAIIQCCR